MKNKQTVVEIILYLAECNLFSSELMQNNVITSVGIQSRYLKAIERRQPQDKKYWLLSDDKGQENAPINEVNSNNNSINVVCNPTNDCNSTQSKVNKSKVNESKVNESEVNQTKANQIILNEMKLNQTKDNQSSLVSVEELREVDVNILEQWNAFSQMRERINKPLSGYS